MTEETLVLVLTGQKWVNVIMWPLHQRNLSPEQPQQRGDVLMTNPWGALPPSPSSNSALYTLVFLPAILNQGAADNPQPVAVNQCADKLTFYACTSVTPRVSPSWLVSISPCLPHKDTHTHANTLTSHNFIIAWDSDTLESNWSLFTKQQSVINQPAPGSVYQPLLVCSGLISFHITWNHPEVQNTYFKKNFPSPPLLVV